MTSPSDKPADVPSDVPSAEVPAEQDKANDISTPASDSGVMPVEVEDVPVPEAVREGDYVPTEADYEKARTEGIGNEPELPPGVVRGN